MNPLLDDWRGRSKIERLRMTYLGTSIALLFVAACSDSLIFIALTGVNAIIALLYSLGKIELEE